MNMPPNDSAFWPFARFALVFTLLLAMLALNYNRLDARDLNTLITVMSGLGLFDGLKAATAPRPTSDKGE